MSWNKEKILRELDGKELRKGVLQAVYERPKLGCKNVIEHLKSGKASNKQVANGLLLLLEFVRSNTAELDNDTYINLIHRYITSANENVRFKAAYCLLNFTLWAQVYTNITEFKSNTEIYLELIESNCPELFQRYSAQIKYIREQGVSNA
jgi:hypothetical protein